MSRRKRADFYSNTTKDMFPILVEALHPETEEVVWTVTLERPTYLEVPKLHGLGHPVDWRVTYADGVVIERRYDDD